MSLPKQLYDAYKELTQCKLVSDGVVNEDTLTEFQKLVNAAQPTTDDAEGQVQRAFTKSLYYSNPVGFMQYIAVSRNRVSALVLWTESKRIVRFFGLQGRVYLSWDVDTQLYKAMYHNTTNVVNESKQLESTNVGNVSNKMVDKHMSKTKYNNRYNNNSHHSSDTDSKRERFERGVKSARVLAGHGRNGKTSDDRTSGGNRTRTSVRDSVKDSVRNYSDVRTGMYKKTYAGTVATSVSTDSTPVTVATPATPGVANWSDDVDVDVSRDVSHNTADLSDTDTVV